MTATDADIAPNCPKCNQPRVVFTSFQAVTDLAICPQCLGYDSPPIILRRKPDRRRQPRVAEENAADRLVPMRVAE
jgi:hypothetical protein